jgi:ketosteroid isomerase-like protein
VEGIRRVFDAFGGGDKRALFEVIAEDAVWSVPGTAQVSRTYEGRAEIFGLFKETRRLTGGSYFSRLRWALADDAHGVAVYRASGERPGRRLDIDQVLTIDLEDGRWRRILALPSDPAAFAAFWA